MPPIDEGSTTLPCTVNYFSITHKYQPQTLLCDQILDRKSEKNGLLFQDLLHKNFAKLGMMTSRIILQVTISTTV